MDIEHLTSFLHDASVVKALLGLVFVILLIGLLRFLLKRFYGTAFHHDHGKMTRILDVCPLEGDRKILLFACPFSQGLILLSPKGDQVVLFDGSKDGTDTG